ncbi:DEAD/DEAH box helicase [Dyadobacter psychrotolerans]|uniref:DEAD/DEAH box helicase n=1 Tax=Dyadobacter psychrotolerans TaxID=2541721 RepID=A0A4R5DUX1_9BACT|nr:DEAD/DEAH box helicase [Dyadobacter psychrotolerans]TDE14783.1 DEAD/DEAH box helicase [Dyadobacter psychrotolerans]
MSYDLLSEPIRKYVRDQRWEQLRPIQTAAITAILSTKNNYILASRTASGKTEAAFLPILSQVDFNQPGVQVLYISPLIALINDQFGRVEDLCKNLQVDVTKWHGEANRALKERLLKRPSGIVLITPESIEAMFVNKPYHVSQLFSNLQFVVIDEIHSFLGTDRGIQLKSLLSRLQHVNCSSFRTIGLSATIGDYQEAKKFTGNENGTKVLLDRTAKSVKASFKYFEASGSDLPLDLFKDLYLQTKDSNALIFPNSRGLAEEIAVKLKKISDRVKGHPNYFSHHSSVDKEVREYVEYFAKNNKREHFSISCTSTLELGIDIGAVDQVVQIDSTFSVSSLIQRVGRSGRKEGAESILQFYTTSPWELLRSLACWVLYQEGFIEPPAANDKPYDLLLHQALSITKGHSGISIADLSSELKRNFAFESIEQTEITELLGHLIKIDLLEKIRDEVIVGVTGEEIVNDRDFYSVFQKEENFKVVNGANRIGEIPFSPQINVDQNLLLAARIWKIRTIDEKAKKIEVIPASDGKKPVFFGGGGATHPRIWEKMLEILISKEDFEVLSKVCREELRQLRQEFEIFDLTDYQVDRPLIRYPMHFQFFSFTGTKINNTIKLLMDMAAINCQFSNLDSSFEIENSKGAVTQFAELTKHIAQIDNYLLQLLEDNPSLMEAYKWGKYLPVKYQVALIKNTRYDVDQTKRLLSNIKIITSRL